MLTPHYQPPAIVFIMSDAQAGMTTRNRCSVLYTGEWPWPSVVMTIFVHAE
jgi:hypothetical protein